MISDHPDLVESVDHEVKEVCRKDTGEHKKVRTWSRGYQFVIGGGGHIESFTPLYQ